MFTVLKEIKKANPDPEHGKCAAQQREKDRGEQNRDCRTEVSTGKLAFCSWHLTAAAIEMSKLQLRAAGIASGSWLLAVAAREMSTLQLQASSVFVSRRLIRFRCKTTFRHPTTRVVTPLQGLDFVWFFYPGLTPRARVWRPFRATFGIFIFTLWLSYGMLLTQTIAKHTPIATSILFLHNQPLLRCQFAKQTQSLVPVIANLTFQDGLFDLILQLTNNL